MSAPATIHLASPQHESPFETHSQHSGETVANTTTVQVDDLNRNFTFPANHFDLVHSRLLATGIHRSRWPSYIRDIVRCEHSQAAVGLPSVPHKANPFVHAFQY